MPLTEETLRSTLEEIIDGTSTALLEKHFTEGENTTIIPLLRADPSLLEVLFQACNPQNRETGEVKKLALINKSWKLLLLPLFSPKENDTKTLESDFISAEMYLKMVYFMLDCLSNVFCSQNWSDTSNQNHNSKMVKLCGFITSYVLISLKQRGEVLYQAHPDTERVLEKLTEMVCTVSITITYQNCTSVKGTEVETMLSLMNENLLVRFCSIFEVLGEKYTLGGKHHHLDRFLAILSLDSPTVQHVKSASERLFEHEKHDENTLEKCISITLFQYWLKLLKGVLSNSAVDDDRFTAVFTLWMSLYPVWTAIDEPTAERHEQSTLLGGTAAAYVFPILFNRQSALSRECVEGTAEALTRGIESNHKTCLLLFLEKFCSPFTTDNTFGNYSFYGCKMLLAAVWKRTGELLLEHQQEESYAAILHSLRRIEKEHGGLGHAWRGADPTECVWVVYKIESHFFISLLSAMWSSQREDGNPNTLLLDTLKQFCHVYTPFSENSGERSKLSIKEVLHALIDDLDKLTIADHHHSVGWLLLLRSVLISNFSLGEVHVPAVTAIVQKLQNSMNDNRALCAFVAANVLKAASHMTSHDHQKSASILQCLCALMDMAFTGDSDVGLFNATESLFYLLQNNTELSMQDLSLKEERVKSLMRFLSLKEEGLSLAQGKSTVHFDFTLTRHNDVPSRSITAWHHFLSNTSENTNNSHANAQENPENQSEQHARDNNNDSLSVLKNCHQLLREWLSDVTNNNNNTNNNKHKRGREELETLSTIVQDGGTILKKLKESIPTEQQKSKTSKSRTPSSSPNIVQID